MMIVRFNTHEEAGIYSGRMRADGHYAEVLDEGTGFLWGPMAVGGFRVVVTDEPMADEISDEIGPRADTEIGRLIRMLVVGLAVLGTAAAVLMTIGREVPAHSNPGTIPAAFLLILLGGLLLAPICLAMTRALRNEQSPTGAVLRALAVIYVVGTLLTGLVSL